MEATLRLTCRKINQLSRVKLSVSVESFVRFQLCRTSARTWLLRIVVRLTVDKHDYREYSREEFDEFEKKKNKEVSGLSVHLAGYRGFFCEESQLS